MSATVSPSRRLSFGHYEVDLQSRELRKHGIRIRLQSQPFELLVMLLERRGELVTREEICQRLWSADTFVDFDHSLGTAINKIREVLNDSAAEPRFVETLPRRG
jgi:DNA-binding winged helix-turn-helix (wHTH) protein